MRKMKRPTITYKVEPSFNDKERLHVVIAWDDHRGQFMFDIKKGIGPNKRRWLAESPDLDEILRDTATLHLPLNVDGPAGLDGTGYHFQIGGVPSVTIFWWMEMPAEWGALKSIVDRIHCLVEKDQ